MTKFRTIILAAAAVLAVSPVFADEQHAAPQAAPQGVGDVYIVTGGQKPAADVLKQLEGKGFALQTGIPTDKGCFKVKLGNETKLRCPNRWVQRKN